MALISVDDLSPTTKDAFEGDELVGILEGLNAKAARVAPCLSSTDPAPSAAQLAEAKLLLLGTVKRWADAGAGALTQKSQTAGPFNTSESYDTRQRTGYNLWPSEITDLQAICAGSDDGDAAGGVDMIAVTGSSGIESRPDLWFQWVQPTPHGAP